MSFMLCILGCCSFQSLLPNTLHILLFPNMFVWNNSNLVLDEKKKWGSKSPRTGDEGICGHLEPGVVVTAKFLLKIGKAQGGSGAARRERAGCWRSWSLPVRSHLCSLCPLPLFYCKVKGKMQTSPKKELGSKNFKVEKMKTMPFKEVCNCAEIRSLTQLLSLPVVGTNSHI